MQMRRIRSGAHTITTTVLLEPTRAGIDRYHLLIHLETDDDVGAVKTKR